MDAPFCAPAARVLGKKDKFIVPWAEPPGDTEEEVPSIPFQQRFSVQGKSCNGIGSLNVPLQIDCVKIGLLGFFEGLETNRRPGGSIESLGPFLFSWKAPVDYVLRKKIDAKPSSFTASPKGRVVRAGIRGPASKAESFRPDRYASRVSPCMDA